MLFRLVFIGLLAASPQVLPPDFVCHSLPSRLTPFLEIEEQLQAEGLEGAEFNWPQIFSAGFNRLAMDVNRWQANRRAVAAIKRQLTRERPPKRRYADEEYE